VCHVYAVLATLPWHECDVETVCLELKNPGVGLSLEAVAHPFDTILQAGLVISPKSRHLTLDQLRNTLSIAMVVATTQVSTRWLYCMESPQYSIRLKVLSYLCTSYLLPAFDDA